MTDTPVSDAPPVEEERQLTPEELEAYKNQMQEFYKEQIPLLSLQREYEVLLTEIEEARTRRVIAMMQMAQIKTRSEEAQENSAKGPASSNKPRRNLKS